MARPISDSVDVPNATTRVQISTLRERVLTITFRGRKGNSGNVYVGDNTVAAAAGFELTPGDSITMDPSQAQVNDSRVTILLSDFYVDAASNGDDVDYMSLVV